MAMMKCPECGREVSSKATACPNCGCPISELSPRGVVRIRLPRTEQMADGLVGLFCSKTATISSNGRPFWRGKHGETASFTVNGPTHIVIDLGTWGNPVKGVVYPRKRYELVQDYGFHMKATFRLSEVDVIDSGL